MAKLTDLPADVVYLIIDYFIDHPSLDDRHQDLDHDGIGPTPPKLSPLLLANKEICPCPYHTIRSASGPAHQSLQVSWPEALPSNPLLSLSLISQTFRQCAQEALFKHVALRSPWQACLFLQALTCQSNQDESNVSRDPIDTTRERGRDDTEGEPASTDRLSVITHDDPRPKRLVRHVRSLLFKWRGPGSMGNGGGSMICEVLRHCPLLESIAIGTTLFSRCQEPILKALASRPFIKEFVVLKNPTSKGVLEFQWQTNEALSQLCSSWNLLEAIKFRGLAGRPLGRLDPLQNPIPALNSALRSIVLDRPNVNEVDLSWILTNSRQSLRKLAIINPSSKLDRPGLCRLLKEFTNPDLESLMIRVKKNWYPLPSRKNDEGSDDPARNRCLLNIVFKSSSALRKLKDLNFHGALANTELFTILPQSIVKLAWGDCHLNGPAFGEALSSSVEITSDPPCARSDPSLQGLNKRVKWLPNLTCCSIGNSGSWEHEDQAAIRKAMKARGVCFHSWGNSEFLSDSDSDDSDWTDSDTYDSTSSRSSDDSGEDSSDDSTSDDSTSDDSTSDDSTSDESTSDESTSDVSTSDDSTFDASTSDDSPA
ncbi:hypothetical protein PSTG_01263 [Puccinia striiformis f. sp. tritici PST-78]|uniref:Uncharacterized protein n=1 Tax=Puccinia striiformis f. sp. tritici PST-78 TaxID=1165861 RepID=A0A0L0W1N4_9BASI|nr:hypothetical protein PSTG_01263 [Puccinia striiformis f. sp. tritici PST-78]